MADTKIKTNGKPPVDVEEEEGEDVSSNLNKLFQKRRDELSFQIIWVYKNKI